MSCMKQPGTGIGGGRIFYIAKFDPPCNTVPISGVAYLLLLLLVQDPERREREREREREKEREREREKADMCT